jgi:hypothetical protein
LIVEVQYDRFEIEILVMIDDDTKDTFFFFGGIPFLIQHPAAEYLM